MNKGILLVVTLAIGVQGCALKRFGNVNSADNDQAYDTTLNDDQDLVASNLVFALAQLPGLAPIQTTVQLTEPISGLGKTVLARLENAGYGVQRVDTDLGPKYVRYKYENSSTEMGPVKRYSMSIGNTEVSRDFMYNEGNIAPDSALEISGAREVSIELNDNIFVNRGTNYEEAVFFTNESLPVISDLDSNTIALNNEPPAELLVRKNLYETRASNYKQMFAAYEDVESKILIFNNDSTVLGTSNKAVVRKIAESMKHETDLISIIGCSHGKSNIKNGNSVLAIGRANRVKEAFVYAGVDHTKVMEEGCWAPRHFDEMMPRRGVVLTHKRRKN